MALTGETISEAALRYEMSALVAQRERTTLFETVRGLLKLARGSDTLHDEAQILAFAERTAGQDGDGNFARINELNRTIALDTQIAAGLRQLEVEGRRWCQEAQMTGIIEHAKAVCFDQGIAG
jgi:hypothetical protein